MQNSNPPNYNTPGNNKKNMLAIFTIAGLITTVFHQELVKYMLDDCNDETLHSEFSDILRIQAIDEETGSRTFLGPTAYFSVDNWDLREILMNG